MVCMMNGSLMKVSVISMLVGVNVILMLSGVRYWLI